MKFSSFMKLFGIIFAGLSKEEQEAIIEGAKQTSSRSEMRSYVENMFR